MLGNIVSRIEHDLHGRQINTYKIINNLNRTEKDNFQFNPITEHMAELLSKTLD
jgi:hypothetical protein